jgi:hypothetical protein
VHFKNTITKKVSNEVHVYLNVFFVLMLHWIFGELNDTLIFTPVCGWMLLLESKL